jgi:Tfp pilus assembly protein PilN
MRAVNLLPRDEVPKSFQAKRGVAFGAGGGLALVTVALTALMLAASGKVSENQAAVDSNKAELAALPKPAGADKDVAADAALVGDLNQRSNALSAALATRVAWDSVLRQVSQVLPEDVWLTSLASASADASESDPNAGGANGVVLTGSTYAQSGVARLLSRLSVAPTLTNVRLQSSTVADAGTSQLVQFTILADVKPAGGGSS